MVIWVAILPRVDQLAKVMPNFWRAVYMGMHKYNEDGFCLPSQNKGFLEYYFMFFSTQNN